MLKRKVVTAICVFSAFTGIAQNNRMIYATSSKGDGLPWFDIRRIDTEKGNNADYLLNYTSSKNQTQQRVEGSLQTPVLLAAAAMERSGKKLFFIPMHQAELRWMDAGNQNASYTYLKSPVLSQLNFKEEGHQITRMAVAADGNGYALSNDGHHLIQFTTGSRPLLTDLGSINDLVSGSSISIHTKCTSWGGDLIATTDGMLMLFSMYGNVFQIDPIKRSAIYIGKVEGLPQNFTINGAAVDASGNIVVGCSMKNQRLYKVDLRTLRVIPEEQTSDLNINASDLASMNLAVNPFNKNTTFNWIGQENQAVGIASVLVYPNPSFKNQFRVNFEGLSTGIHTIQLTDLSGRVLFSKKIEVIAASQTEQIEIGANYTKGMYLIQVLNQNSRSVYNGKVMLY
ncbi:MAG: T9SS type A sorting domain-containing protein [Lacibacter sp.]